MLNFLPEEILDQIIFLVIGPENCNAMKLRVCSKLYNKNKLIIELQNKHSYL